jgi:putative restriction endonuclease
LDLALEIECRAAAFLWLGQQVTEHGELLPASLLREGFEFRGNRIPLTVQQGIHKPACLSAALSLRTALGSPYRDEFDGEDALLYRYRGQDPDTWDNRSARVACEQGLPVVYLHQLPARDKRYLALWPIYIVEDHRSELTFRLQAQLSAGLLPRVDVPGASLAGFGPAAMRLLEGPSAPIERRYATALTLRRLHQASFRAAVLSAYAESCAMCRLRHPKLLDAAHIVPDADPSGAPQIQNGISLCRIHHGAFDIHYVSIKPKTLRIRVRSDLLQEHDGPMLRHGLQALEGQLIGLPRRREHHPDRDRLERHFQRFNETG